MTTAEHTAIKEFVLADDSNWETAMAVCNALPEIKKEVCEPFLEKLQEKVLGKLKSDTDNLLVGAKASGVTKYATYVYIYSRRWRPYDARKRGGAATRASIYLCAAGEGPNNWYITVPPPIPISDMEEADRSRWKEIETRLHDTFGRGYRGNYDVWFEYVKDEYRDWDPLIPAICQELQQGEGGEILRYFVEKFVEIAEVAVPIIDSLEVDPSS